MIIIANQRPNNKVHIMQKEKQQKSYKKIMNKILF